MNKYIISYKQEGIEHKARVEISKESDILSFLANNIPIHKNLFMKKVLEFRRQDMSHKLITDKPCEEE